MGVGVREFIREQQRNIAAKAAARMLNGDPPEPERPEPKPVFTPAPKLPTPEPVQPPPLPWDVKSVRWIQKVLVDGPVRTFAAWSGAFYERKLRPLVKAVLSRRYAPTDTRYLRREQICRACEYQVTTAKGKRYCKPCGCGKWFMSRLDNKNRMSGWDCPKGRHPKYGNDKPGRGPVED